MRRMYSKKQLEELISQMSGDILEVKNVKQLNDEQCNGLKVGDIVAKKTGKQYHCYIVTFKQDKGGLCLSYFDASCIETQSYDYTAGHWVYNSEDKTEFSAIGGLPDVTSADNGKVLEVLAGAWGKGGKKVNVIDAPTSTTLDDDTIAKIKEGIFINGLFLNIHNPVFFPAKESSGYYYGMVEGVYAEYPGPTTFRAYKIDKSTKVISLYNTVVLDLDPLLRGFNLYAESYASFQGKRFPAYPNDNVNTYTLKLVAGVLTWVQDV